VQRVGGAIEDAVKAAVNATTRRLDELPGSRVRRLRRLARNPLPYLYDVHPEARHASPRELGVQTINVDDIGGTAVGPPGQRGMDFLPMKPLRTLNWQARWQRVRAANDRLAILPPIDVVRFGGRYWVLDGHNRVASALYGGQVEIDANVVELGRPDGKSSSPPGSLVATMQDHDDLKAVLSRRTIGDASARPAGGSGQEPEGSSGDRDRDRDRDREQR
jgi:hypothetical protein